MEEFTYTGTDPKDSSMGTAGKNSPGLSDISAAVVQALREGDHKAYAYIYLHYSEGLTRFLTSLMQSREEAEEITQEVFITLWEKREIFEPEKGLRRYIYQLAKFYALNHFDRQKVRGKYEEFLRRSDAYDLAGDEIMQGEEMAILIEFTLARMPHRQQEIFRMSREEKMSYDEIAAKLGISVNTVKFHMKNTLKEIRKKILATLLAFFLS